MRCHRYVYALPFLLIMFFAVSMGGAQSASAQVLTKASVKVFVKTVPTTKKLAQYLEVEGFSLAVANFAPSPSKTTEIAPYMRSVSILAVQHPEAYDVLNDIVVKYGFPSAESWASVGDQIIMTYKAIIRENPKEGEVLAKEQLKQIPPAMLRNMSRAHQRDMLDSLMLSSESGSGVTAEDKALVRPYLRTIHSW